MKIKKLRRTHADFDLACIERNRALMAGGDDFAEKVDRFLPKHEQEPLLLYQRRCAVAADEYINYAGPIVNFFVAWLFTSELTFKTDPESIDPFYDLFKEDVDGKGLELDHFLTHRFVDAAQDGCTHWRVSFPEAPPLDVSPQSRAEWEKDGLGRATLVPMPASSIINWKKDECGEYEWLVEYTKTCQLEEPDDDVETVTETWTIWRADGDHQRFEIEYPKGKKPSDDLAAPEVPMTATQGAIEGLPVVTLKLPPQMWIMNLIAAPQLANFRKRAALSWAIDRNCYAMPVFNMKGKRKPGLMGTGYYITLGENEKAGYMAPPSQPFDVIKSFVSELKDEIHRVAQQMARGVDNNAAAVGRSGRSKEADDMATEIVLAGFGKHIRAAAKRTMDLVAEGRGDKIVTTVGGMESYHITDADSFARMALATQGLNIPSSRHHQLVAERQSALMLPDIGEPDRKLINKQIEANITDESIEASLHPPEPKTTEMIQPGQGLEPGGAAPTNAGDGAAAA